MRAKLQTRKSLLPKSLSQRKSSWIFNVGLILVDATSPPKDAWRIKLKISLKDRSLELVGCLQPCLKGTTKPQHPVRVTTN